MHGGTHCVLIDSGSRDHVLQSGTHWSGRSDIGKVEVWSDGTFSDGLTASRDGNGDDDDADADGLMFFAAVREHHRFVLPTFEITPTFLWYWDAFPSEGGWSYLAQQDAASS
jgi:hypothetical protein